jgi:hypothetical protein
MIPGFRFRFDYFTAAVFCSATELHAYFGGNTGAGYEGGYLVGGQEQQRRATGRADSPDGPADKPAFPHRFRPRILASPGGAGADSPCGGVKRVIAQRRRGKTVQRVQLVDSAVNQITVNIARVFFELRFYLFDERSPHTLFCHRPSSIL